MQKRIYMICMEMQKNLIQKTISVMIQDYLLQGGAHGHYTSITRNSYKTMMMSVTDTQTNDDNYSSDVGFRINMYL